MRKIVLLSGIVLMLFAGFRKPQHELAGAWVNREGSREHLITIVDDYLVYTVYDEANRKFEYTLGGPVERKGQSLQVVLQFNTLQKELVGTTFSYVMSWKEKNLMLEIDGKQREWTKVDAGAAPLAGVWRISGRKQNGQVSDIALGARRTLKVLTGTRFQWTAINIDTKEFFGTGGGTYTFENGKYTEKIAFFSRDSSRVGASLSFDGKIENGDWHHSGLSSKGEPIYEIWTRLKK